MNKTEIYTILEKALSETQRGSSVKHPFSPSLQIAGKESVFDSLDTMIFLNAVDDLLSEKTGKTVTVINDDVFAREESPFRTIETLAVYIEELLPLL